MNILDHFPHYDPGSPYVEIPVIDVNEGQALPPVTPVGGGELRLSNAEPPPWLWHGYVGRGSMTLLTSLWKSGKTTLVSHLLQAIRKGEPMFLGQELTARKVAIVSEESESLWAERARRLEYTDDIQLLMRPLAGRPDVNVWTQFVGQLLRFCKERGIGFVVIDPVANFMCGDENDARSMQDFLKPLAELTRADMAVMLLHHPRKRGGSEGTASRGSGALMAFVDIILEMKRPPRAPKSRTRIIEGYSRFLETPTELRIELEKDGYRVVESH